VWDVYIADRVNALYIAAWWHVTRLTPLTTRSHAFVSTRNSSIADKPPVAALAGFCDFYLPLSHLTPSIWEIPWSYRIHIWYRKTRTAGLQSGGGRIMIDTSPVDCWSEKATATVSDKVDIVNIDKVPVHNTLCSPCCHNFVVSWFRICHRIRDRRYYHSAISGVSWSTLRTSGSRFWITNTDYLFEFYNHSLVSLGFGDICVLHTDRQTDGQRGPYYSWPPRCRVLTSQWHCFVVNIALLYRHRISVWEG